MGHERSAGWNSLVAIAGCGHGKARCIRRKSYFADIPQPWPNFRGVYAYMNYTITACRTSGASSAVSSAFPPTVPEVADFGHTSRIIISCEQDFAFKTCLGCRYQAPIHFPASMAPLFPV